MPAEEPKTGKPETESKPAAGKPKLKEVYPRSMGFGISMTEKHPPSVCLQLDKTTYILSPEQARIVGIECTGGAAMCECLVSFLKMLVSSSDEIKLRPSTITRILKAMTSYNFRESLKNKQTDFRESLKNEQPDNTDRQR